MKPNPVKQKDELLDKQDFNRKIENEFIELNNVSNMDKYDLQRQMDDAFAGKNEKTYDLV